MKTRKATKMVIISVFLCITVCLYFIAPWIFVGYCPFNLCAPHRSFHVLDLKLPAYLFPDKTVNADIVMGKSSSPITFEEGVGGVTWGGYTQVLYDVYRFPKEKQASEFYKYVRYISLEDEYRNEELDFIAIADEYTAVCGVPINIYMGDNACSMVARIDEYVFDLTVNGNDEEAIALFNRIINYIEEDMSEKLEK